MLDLEKTLITQIRRGRSSPELYFRGWIAQVQEDPEQVRDLKAATKTFLHDVNFVRTLVRSGVTLERNLSKELFGRLFEKFIPRVYDDSDFISVLHRMEQENASARVLLRLPPSTLRDLLVLLAPDDAKTAHAMRARLAEVMRVLSIRISYQGLAFQVADRLAQHPELRSGFLSLPKLASQFVETRTCDSHEALLAGLETCISACRAIRRMRAERGISLDLTYRLIIIQDACNRLKLVANLYQGLLTQVDANLVEGLVRQILEAEVELSGVRRLVLRYLSLVFFQITEHTGRAGEKYIARKSAEYWRMARKGLAGGALVGLFAWTKPWVSMLHLAPIPEGLAYGLVYSTIFVGIYLTHGVLATKQPAMTASRLASELDEVEASQRFLWNLSSLVIMTFRTQIVAVVGNILLTFPMACLMYSLLLFTGWKGFPDTKILTFLESLDPVGSLTVWYAAVTGVVLSLSGIVAGAVTNWFVYNNVGRRLERTLARRRVTSQNRARKISGWFLHHSSPLIGNVVLGFALGVLPTLGYIFGLPLDVRHITFATAQVGTALVHMGTQTPWDTFAWAVAGVFATGAVNLTVSFGLTLYVVLTSRNITFAQERRLLVLCAKRFLKNPFLFLFPLPLSSTGDGEEANQTASAT